MIGREPFSVGMRRNIVRREMATVICVMVAVLWSVAVSAADFESGMRAFEENDFAAARSQWTTAAIEGDARAQYELGMMLANGVGVPRDVISAYAWLMLAHKGGVPDAEDKFTMLHKGYIPRHCHFDALALVREFETGHPEKLAAGGRQKSRCWNFKQQ